MKRILLSLFTLFFLILLLGFPSAALEGARNGLLLWAYTVLPALLPFMIITGIITALDIVNLAVRPFFPLLSGFFHFSQPACFVFLTGLLCGYPMGAKMDRDLLERDQITPTEAKYLLAVCNHPSPMFLTGYTALEGQKLFPASKSFPLIIFLIALYLPVFPVSILARHYYEKKERNAKNAGFIYDPAQNGKTTEKPKVFSLDDHLISCLETMEKIGLYIMLFSILSLYLFRFPLPGPILFKSALMGLLEITTGIRTICENASGLPGLLLITASVSFGGISGIFQTRSVLSTSSDRKNAGLSIRHYIFWKALHSLLSCAFLFVLWKFYASSFFSS